MENERGSGRSGGGNEIDIGNLKSVVVDKSIVTNISGDKPKTKINSDEDLGGQRGHEVLLVPVDTNLAPVEST